MREIKFRAWCKFPTSNSYFMSGWDEVSEWTMGSADRRISDFLRNTENCTLMQYTGLKDKNGKEIYEGDILQIPYITPFGDVDYKTEGDKIIVEFKEGMFGYNTNTRFIELRDFMLKEEGEYISGFGNTLTYKDFIGKIIGNIYENPELLNK